MRLAVVAPVTVHHAATDATQRTADLLTHLATHGHTIGFFTAKWWAGSPRSFEHDGITYHALANGLAEPPRRFVPRLPPAIHEFDPDVILTTHTDTRIIATASLVSNVIHTPLVVDWYDWQYRSGWGELARPLAARIPTTVITPSQLVETKVRELGRSATDTTVIPYGIDIDRVRNAQPEHIGDIVYSRPLDSASNLDSLLLALAELRDNDWIAVVIGDGPHRDHYEQHAAELRIDDRVRFIGDQPLDRRLGIFKAAHVAVHTATYAPFATDFLRSLACGCVGIAEYHSDSSAHELIRHRSRGFRTTGEPELVNAIREAADFPRRTYEEAYEAYDYATVHDRFHTTLTDHLPARET